MKSSFCKQVKCDPGVTAYMDLNMGVCTCCGMDLLSCLHTRPNTWLVTESEQEMEWMSGWVGVKRLPRWFYGGMQYGVALCCSARWGSLLPNANTQINP